MAIITLTSDFGLRDWFVGTMKGVMLSIQPEARIIDLTHEVPAGHIYAGAFVLAAGYAFFPAGTVHVAVVDPGVGSSRVAIAVETEKFYFVGPNNGVLSLALAREVIRRVHRLENKAYFLPEVSQTFHGRDIFAPVAAHLSKGEAIDRLGPAASDYLRLTLPTPVREPGRATGVVVYIDHFGNAITNIPAQLLAPERGERLEVRVAGYDDALPLCSHYQAVPEGKPLALVGSAGYLEIALNGGSAAAALRLGFETRVQVNSRNQSV